MPPLLARNPNVSTRSLRYFRILSMKRMQLIPKIVQTSRFKLEERWSSYLISRRCCHQGQGKGRRKSRRCNAKSCKRNTGQANVLHRRLSFSTISTDNRMWVDIYEPTTEVIPSSSPLKEFSTDVIGRARSPQEEGSRCPNLATRSF